MAVKLLKGKTRGRKPKTIDTEKPSKHINEDLLHQLNNDNNDDNDNDNDNNDNNDNDNDNGDNDNDNDNGDNDNNDNSDNDNDNDNELEKSLSDISQCANMIIDKEKQDDLDLPKKRGRKAKNKMFDDTPIKDDDKMPKKRGRKPKEKFGVVPQKQEEKNEDYIILKLPIHASDLDEVEFTGDKLLRYSDKINPDPQSYSPHIGFHNLDKHLSKLDEQIEKSEPINMNKHGSNFTPSMPNPLESNVTKLFKEKTQPVEYTREELQKRFENIKEKKSGLLDQRHSRQIRLMVQFQESNRRGEWPHQTNLHCFWCVHPFESVPWGIPVKYVDNMYHVDGNFCSPECAAAYNFEQKDYNMWERYMLLNMLYNKINMPKYQKLKLAPPRRMLIQFGGNMCIEDFRKYCQNYSKDYFINFPPMVSIPTMAEEVNLSDQFRQKIIIMDPKRVDDAKRRCEEQDKELMQQDISLYKCFDRIANMG